MSFVLQFSLANFAKTDLRGYLKTSFYYTTITEILHILIRKKNKKDLTLVGNCGMINNITLANVIGTIAMLCVCPTDINLVV